MNCTLAGVTTDFSFSAVRAPKRTGIMGSSSPWHCRMAMSLFTPLLAACRRGGREKGRGWDRAPTVGSAQLQLWRAGGHPSTPKQS